MPYGPEDYGYGAQVLRRMFGLPVEPDDQGGDGALYGDVSGSIGLNRARQDLRSRGRDNVFYALRSGDPNEIRAQEYNLSNLDRDINDDPSTGLQAQARSRGIQNTLDQASMLERPEIEEASRTRAERDAFAKLLGVGAEATAKYRADVSPEGQLALDLASGRKRAELATAAGAKPVTVSAAGKSALTALNDMETLGPNILQTLKMKYPGIDTNPAQFGGALDTARAKGQKLLYNLGIDTRDSDVGQLEQLFKVIAARPYMAGRPNQRIYEDIVSHLGDFGFSPGADYERIRRLVDLIPDLRAAVEEAEQPMTMNRRTPTSRTPGAAGGGLPAGVTVTPR